MVVLSEKEKKELLKLARSKQLKKDFMRLKKNHNLSFYKIGYSNADRYIKFLGFCDNFVNSRQKVFRKIKGSNFKI